MSHPKTSPFRPTSVFKRRSHGINSLIAASDALSSLCRESNRNAPLTDLFRCAADAENSVKSLVPMLNELVASLTFDSQTSIKAAQTGYSTAADCVDYLIAKGESKSAATEIVTKLCVYCRTAANASIRFPPRFTGIFG
ncbi:MAG: hypothetical protein ACLUSP_01025 [Christensenellales bacterium]